MLSPCWAEANSHRSTAWRYKSAVQTMCAPVWGTMQRTSAGCCMRSRRPCRAPAGYACPRAPTVSCTEQLATSMCSCSHAQRIDRTSTGRTMSATTPGGTSAGAQTGWEERARAVPAGVEAPAVVAAVQRAALDAPLCANMGRVTQLPRAYCKHTECHEPAEQQAVLTGQHTRTQPSTASAVCTVAQPYPKTYARYVLRLARWTEDPATALALVPASEAACSSLCER